MKTNSKTEIEPFKIAGDRLNEVLDQIGFKKGRGRMADFQNYLMDKSPEIFSDLKYTTVRAWFLDSSPPMRKIDAIIKALQIDFELHHDIDLIKTWWKIGGSYPFTEKYKSLSVNNGMSKEELEKLEFVVMSLIVEQIGNSSRHFDTTDLIVIKNYIIKFAKDFADPEKAECPHELLKIVIKSKLEDL